MPLAAQRAAGHTGSPAEVVQSFTKCRTVPCCGSSARFTPRQPLLGEAGCPCRARHPWAALELLQPLPCPHTEEGKGHRGPAWLCFPRAQERLVPVQLSSRKSTARSQLEEQGWARLARLQPILQEPAQGGHGAALGGDTSSCSSGQRDTPSPSCSSWSGIKAAEKKQFFTRSTRMYFFYCFGELHIISVKCKILPFPITLFAILPSFSLLYNQKLSTRVFNIRRIS